MSTDSTVAGSTPDDSEVLLAGVGGPQPVRFHSYSPYVPIVNFTQHDAQMAGKTLQEQEQEE
jgi:hypothetical protein